MKNQYFIVTMEAFPLALHQWNDIHKWNCTDNTLTPSLNASIVMLKQSDERVI